MKQYVCMIFLMIFSTKVYSLESDGASAQETKSTIAVLDLQQYYQPSSHDEFIEKIKEALHQDGFFALKNTGVNKQVLESAYGAIKQFFAFPMDKKMLVDGVNTNQQRGYTTIGKEAAKGSPIGDFKEFYSVGRGGNSGHWENIWPNFMDLENPLSNFFNHLDDYAVILEEIFSKALGEEKDFLRNICQKGDSSCRLIHYPCDNSSYDKEALWAKAHTDIDLFTILPKATQRGLEVCGKDGKWKSVIVSEDAFIVNAGDFLEIFSNGYFRSAKHRVKKPASLTTDRYSVVMFVHPESDAMLYPLKKWIDIEGAQKFIQATRMEMFMERLADLGVATDKMLQDLAKSKVLERLMTVNRASKEAVEAVCSAGYGSKELEDYLIQQQ